MTEKEIQTEFVDVLGQPEAGFSLNWQMIDGMGANVQVTMRTALVQDWPDVMKQRAEFVDKATKGGWNVPSRLPSANAVAPIPPPGNPNTPRVNGQVPPPVAAGPSESACAMIEIGTSFTGGKPQLSFHVNGMDKPLRYTQSLERMAALLAPLGFTAAHIVVGQKYPVNCIVTWRQGEKYRDVLSVRKA